MDNVQKHNICSSDGTLHEGLQVFPLPPQMQLDKYFEQKLNTQLKQLFYAQYMFSQAYKVSKQTPTSQNAHNAHIS
jgi:hypothetical protein